MTQYKNGLLIFNKPVGLSSHSAVYKARKILGVRKAGHAGTLDPFASGVLLVGLGKATRLLEYLVGHSKTYRATVRLGEIWDTHDATGQLIETRDASGVGAADIEAAAGKFTGISWQTPPLYSAIKLNGRPLCRRVRNGEDVAPPPPRKIEIHKIKFLNFSLPEFTIEVSCSKGTYIRALARDLGEALGCGGVLTALTRLSSGPFSLDEAVDLETLENLGPAAWQRVLPMERMVEELPSIAIDGEEARAMALGRSIEIQEEIDFSANDFAVFDTAGDLVSVARISDNRLAPRKVFLSLS